MDWRVISIGAMAAHPLWGEREPVRTGHATTTLIQTVTDDEARAPVRLLVDPGLPDAALAARLGERANLAPDDITHVFLTSFSPECRRSIGLFERARWLIGSVERETVGTPLALGLKRLATNFDEPDPETEAVLRADIAILHQCEPAPDRVAVDVDLFPLPGVSEGHCGLLLAGRETTLICGDAAPTAEHLDQGMAPPSCWDIERAKESLREALEIADVLVLGRDNIRVNPFKRPF